ncbi:MAG TPA: hypothetical protein VHA56_01135 [Mucilaginibacter sp.]|nr:hypothetical protein [Mucilaginibacter sp.]
MKSGIYKLALVLIPFFGVFTSVQAQSVSVRIKSKPNVSVSAHVDDKDIDLKMDNLVPDIRVDLKDLGKSLSAAINNISEAVNTEVNKAVSNTDIRIDPKVTVDLNNLLNDVDVNVSVDDDDNTTSTVMEKNYSKSYPVDANDLINLSNQFGKITVNTWDRNEVKVGIHIRAEAANESDAQKLIDGVSINDRKDGNQVSFKTDIRRNDNSGFWDIFNFNSKRHKLSINYVVYMPAGTDLNIESSFGSVQLPSLDGRVRISASQGSIYAQSLSSQYNEIEGSYCSVKIATMNGGKLDFSYGSLDLDDCNKIKADLSYTSFSLGKLRTSGDVNLAYGGGLKIGELAGALKSLNINSSYANVAINIAPYNNFNFAISTSYGSGFRYDDSQVVVTAKNPPDGTRHVGPTRSYKGHVGKSESDARVNINTSYGGVNFE